MKIVFFRICIGFEKGKISRDYARSSFLLTTQFDENLTSHNLTKNYTENWYLLILSKTFNKFS